MMNLKNAVQPRMDTDVHGLKTGYVDERLHPIGAPFIVFPSVCAQSNTRTLKIVLTSPKFF